MQYGKNVYILQILQKEKVMKNAMVLALVLMLVPPLCAEGKPEITKQRSITFTMMNYGDFTAQDTLLRELTKDFEAQTGIKVLYEVINWGQAREKITTWHLGGDAPDVSDMFWAFTYSDLGGGEFGTRPIEQELKTYIPDYETRFLKSAFGDVQYKNHLYGIPWRVDVRPLVYRADFFEEAGLDPAGLRTWDDLIKYGQALTVRDEKGNVTRWGLGFSDDPVQFFYNWVYGAGGAFMDKDYKKATLDTEAGRAAVQYLVDMIQKYKVASIDNVIDASYDPNAEFAAGKIAILPATGSLKSFIENNAPQLKNVTVAREPVKNVTQESFQGAGYFGLNYQCKDIDSSMKWLAFLSSDANMLKLSKTLGQLSPNIAALKDPYFQEDWWFRGHVKALPYGRTTQHPNSAWGAITNAQPGGPIYDMLVDALSGKVIVRDAVKRANDDMQALIDKN
jgi:multiple sugar transport system substrate-binding protein